MLSLPPASITCAHNDRPITAATSRSFHYSTCPSCHKPPSGSGSRAPWLAVSVSSPSPATTDCQAILPGCDLLQGTQRPRGLRASDPRLLRRQRGSCHLSEVRSHASCRSRCSLLTAGRRVGTPVSTRGSCTCVATSRPAPGPEDLDVRRAAVSWMCMCACACACACACVDGACVWYGYACCRRPNQMHAGD